MEDVKFLFSAVYFELTDFTGGEFKCKIVQLPYKVRYSKVFLHKFIIISSCGPRRFPKDNVAHKLESLSTTVVEPYFQRCHVFLLT